MRHSSEVVAEAEGVTLHLNPEMPSGYQGYDEGTGRFFEASTSQLGKHISLGKFPTAVEAAVAYARYRATRRSVVASTSDAAMEESAENDYTKVVALESAAPNETPEEATRRQGAFNVMHDPLLRGGDEHRVLALHVSASAAARARTSCASGGQTASWSCPDCSTITHGRAPRHRLLRADRG